MFFFYIYTVFSCYNPKTLLHSTQFNFSMYVPVCFSVDIIFIFMNTTDFSNTSKLVFGSHLALFFLFHSYTLSIFLIDSPSQAICGIVAC